MKNFFFIFVILNILLINAVHSKEKNNFFSLKYNKVNVRQGPSSDYPIKFIYTKKFYPLKIIDSYENFRKILDISNNSGWIHRSQLSKKKSAINMKDNSLIFSKPEIYSKPIAIMKIGRLLLIKKCIDEWCKIKTDKYSGWVIKSNLWGFVD
tara:strand:- start:1055 stop:1510 length:456 start_codon:yes stop_codon:yes gene_type:complete